MRTHLSWPLLLLIFPVAQAAPGPDRALAQPGSAATELRISPAALRDLTVVRTNVAPVNRSFDSAALQVFVPDAGIWKKMEITGQTNRNGFVISSVAEKMAVRVSAISNRQVLTTNRVVLPFGIPGRTAGLDETKYDLELYSEPAPARWNSEREQYETKIFVGIIHPGKRIAEPLPWELPVTLRPAGGVVASPHTLSFSKTLEFSAAELRFPTAESGPSIGVSPFTEKAPFLLTVRKLAKLLVTAQPATILGYGLGTTELTVTRVDEKGMPLNEGPALQFTVGSNAGKASRKAAIPAGQSSVSFKFRSAGSGVDEIGIESGAIKTPITLIYKQPWVFIAFLLAGGLAGASARFLRRENRESERLQKMLIEGCVAGLIATAAMCAGAALSVLPENVQETEIFAFLISAAVAMIGVKGIDWVTKLAPKPVLTVAKEEKTEMPETR